MGKTILELFNSAQTGEYTPPPGIPVTQDGIPASKKYEVRNSKQIDTRGSSPYLTIPFKAQQKLRNSSRLTVRYGERFLEEEITGLRALRAVSSTVLYGTDYVRINQRTTSDVRIMRDSTSKENAAAASARASQNAGLLGNVGKNITQIRTKVNDFLGIPKPLFPSAFIGQDTFVKGLANEKVEVLANIKEKAEGKLIGRYLRTSARGTPEQISGQIIGGGITLAKDAIRKGLYDSQQEGVNRANDDTNYRGFAGRYAEQPKEGVSVGKYSSTMEQYIQYENAQTQYDISRTSPLSGYLRPAAGPKPAGLFGSTKNALYIPPSDNKLSQFGLRKKLTIEDLNTRFSSPIKPHTSFFDTTEPSTIKRNPIFDEGQTGTDMYYGAKSSLLRKILLDKPNTASSQQVNGFGKKQTAGLTATSANPNIVPKTAGHNFDINGKDVYPSAGEGSKKFQKNEVAKNGSVLRKKFITDKTTDVGKITDQLRPSKLKKDVVVKYSDKTAKIKNPYSSKDVKSVSLEGRRGIFSNRDVLNQTSRISQEEIKNKSLKYNGRGLEDMDIIPLRFQRVNDNTAVYLRSILTGFSETFNPSWESSNLLGSPFKFYTYTGIERKVTFTTKLYCMSQLELIRMWSRLEFLAHLTYPYEYNQSGAIEPTLFYLTLGNLYINKAAILTSLNYTIDDQSNLWETGDSIGQIREGQWETTLQDQKEISDYKLLGTNTITSYNREEKKDANNQFVMDNFEEKQFNWKTTNLKWGQGGNANINMDNWKLPKFINAQFDITFIESKNDTHGPWKLYGLDKKIGTGIS